MDAGWELLGFTDEQVVGAWQHWRLARECVAAFAAAGTDPAPHVREGPGEGNHLIYWYLDDAAVRILDAHHVAWRRFAVGRVASAPQGAHCPLKPEDSVTS